MPSFRRLGEVLGAYNGLHRFGGGNVRPQFNWNRSLTFESGFLISSPTGYDAVMGNNMAVNAAAAIRGQYGFDVNIVDVNVRYGIIQGIGRYKHAKVNMLFDPSPLTMAINDSFTILLGVTDAGAGAFRIVITYIAPGNYYLRSSIRTDGPGSIFGSDIMIPNNASNVGLEFKVADYPGANNGYINLYLNGELADINNGIDNDTRNMDRLWVGAIEAVDVGTSGHMYFDDIRYHEYKN